MRTLEIRRHSLRQEGGGSQLSQAGVELARRLGASMGPFARVAASVVPRARETAIAMGFAVTYEVATQASDPAVIAAFGAARWWEAPGPFEALARLVESDSAVRLYAQGLYGLCRDLAGALADGESALLIAHSGDVETALVACLPAADHGAWGGMIGCCEGARLGFDGDPPRFTAAAILRLT